MPVVPLQQESRWPLRVQLMLESAIEGSVVRWWKKLGYLTIKVWKNPGWPDRLFIGPNGLHVWVEFKQPNGRLRPLQEHCIRQLQGLQCGVHVARSIDEAKEILNEALDTPPLPKEGN